MNDEKINNKTLMEYFLKYEIIKENFNKFNKENYELINKIKIIKNKEDDLNLI